MKNTLAMNGESLQDRVGRNIAARLNGVTDNFPHDIAERLRVARALALTQRKVVKVQLASSVTHMGSTAALHMGGEEFSIWNRMASWLPLLALLVGLLAINVAQEEFRAHEIAEVDAELLTDELPPGAYTDQGFAQFLHNQHNQ